MALSFEPFRVWFVKNHPTRKKMDFQKETRLAPGSASKIWEDRFPVRTDIIERICETYDLEVNEVVMRKK